ncbi:MAG: hypothetical protein QOJ02_2492 [Acidobacteriota bacterium]|jgi:hypothetical protein|nr:hypothetical protein [Acidobacteriota bacterium]
MPLFYLVDNTMERTKRCPSCSVEKGISEFGRHTARRDRLQAQCRACKRTLQRNWYHNNKARHVANVAKRRRAEETKIISSIVTYLHQHPCVDCGDDNPVVLEFDHVKGIKKDSICNLISRGYGWETIYAEIQKCEVRCCKCHRIKTARQFGYRKVLLASAS